MNMEGSGSRLGTPLELTVEEKGSPLVYVSWVCSEQEPFVCFGFVSLHMPADSSVPSNVDSH